MLIEMKINTDIMENSMNNMDEPRGHHISAWSCFYVETWKVELIDVESRIVVLGANDGESWVDVS
jgi:hypothetical protein